jgi:hypothetical protein
VNDRDPGVPIEQFIQALTSQLDLAQSTMALKARAGLPLTFAVRDLSIDLRAHVEMVGSVVRIRSAGPGDTEASTIHLALTTITRPMIEENTRQFAAESDDPPLKEVLGNTMTEDEQRRLEWIGVRSVSQLRELERHAGEQAIERVADIPVNRLRMALERTSQPLVTRVAPERIVNGGPVDDPSVLRIHGHNLLRGGLPEVRIGGEQVPVLQATPKELLVAALPHQMAGTLSVETAPGVAAHAEFDLLSNRPPRDPAGENGGPR